jgi:hypothetical protein
MDGALPIVPHFDWGDPACCGCLFIRMRGDQAEIACNECAVVVRSVPAERAREVMLEMMSGVICSASCPHCGALYVFPGFSSIEAFICAECGKGVVVKRAVQ